jgi:hypothetical protein
MNLNSREIKAGTILICPKCREHVAVVARTIYPDFSFDWRVIVPINDSTPIGISSCCDERYVTFSGLFFTESGAI